MTDRTSNHQRRWNDLQNRVSFNRTWSNANKFLLEVKLSCGSRSLRSFIRPGWESEWTRVAPHISDTAKSCLQKSLHRSETLQSWNSLCFCTRRLGLKGHDGTKWTVVRRKDWNRIGSDFYTFTHVTVASRPCSRDQSKLGASSVTAVTILNDVRPGVTLSDCFDLAQIPVDAISLLATSTNSIIRTQGQQSDVLRIKQINSTGILTPECITFSIGKQKYGGKFRRQIYTLDWMTLVLLRRAWAIGLGVTG